MRMPDYVWRILNHQIPLPLPLPRKYCTLQDCFPRDTQTEKQTDRHVHERHIDRLVETVPSSLNTAECFLVTWKGSLGLITSLDYGIGVEMASRTRLSKVNYEIGVFVMD